MYKNLSEKDKENITMYAIYNSVYDVIKAEGIDISEKNIKDISSLAYELYINDEYRNLSNTQIAYFLTECFIKDSTFLEKVKNKGIKYDDILTAVEDDNYEYLINEDEMEMV